MERRQFLKVVGGTGAGIALSPLTAISLSDDWYANSRLGIKLQKPANWHFVAIKDFTRQIDDLASVTEDKELLSKLRDVSGEPILVINKHREPFDGVSPTIQLYANPLDPEMGDVVADARIGEEFTRPYLRDYQLDEPITATRIGSFEAAHWTYNYTLTADRHYKLWAWAGLVRASKAEFSMGMTAPVSGRDSSREVLAKVRDSIELS